MPSQRVAARLVLAAFIGSTATTGAAADEDVRIEWRVPRDQVVELQEQLRLEGTITPDRTTASDSKGLPLIYVFAGLVALPSLVRAISTAIRDIVCGGVVIEDTDQELAIRCEPSLGVNTVVVRSADGTRIERLEEVQDPSRLLDALAKLRSGA